MIRVILLLTILVSALADPSAAAPGDLEPVKLALHLGNVYAKNSQSCAEAPMTYGCGDYMIEPEVIRAHGELGRSYELYIVAVDVPSHVGLSALTFGICYTPVADGHGLYVDSWAPCAGVGAPSRTWPDPGSSITVSFDPCAGTEPDLSDPEWDGFVVIGSLDVYALSPGFFSIAGPGQCGTESPLAVSCSGDTWDFSGRFPTGEVGFGAGYPGLDPCHSVNYDLCLSGSRGGCCGDGPDWCDLPPYAQASERTCGYVGGRWIWRDCLGPPCSEKICNPTPAASQTWSRLKARYH